MDEMQNPSDPAHQSDLNPGIELQDDLEGDTLREECGVFGVFGHPEAAAITALGLHALQHRGQEAAGIVSFDGSRFHSERRLGLVGDTFSRRDVIERLPGTSPSATSAIPRPARTILRNVQPLFADLECRRLRRRPQRQPDQRPDAARANSSKNGAIFQSTTDTEVILHLIARVAGAAVSSTASSTRCARSRAPMRWWR